MRMIKRQYLALILMSIFVSKSYANCGEFHGTPCSHKNKALMIVDFKIVDQDEFSFKFEDHTDFGLVSNDASKTGVSLKNSYYLEDSESNDGVSVLSLDVPRVGFTVFPNGEKFNLSLLTKLQLNKSTSLYKELIRSLSANPNPSLEDVGLKPIPYVAKVLLASVVYSANFDSYRILDCSYAYQTFAVPELELRLIELSGQSMKQGLSRFIHFRQDSPIEVQLDPKQCEQKAAELAKQ